MVRNAVNIHAAKTRLSQLVARAEKGERIVIARNGKPVAQLGPAFVRRRVFSSDDPLLHVEEYAYDGAVGKLSSSDIDQTIYGA
jgi:prevent-host-death family protein